MRILLFFTKISDCFDYMASISYREYTIGLQFKILIDFFALAAIVRTSV